MTCIEVRDRLTEHSLGGLSKTDAREVERHLEWCPGCRKEASELLEGAASMAMALPVLQPPSSLEGRIVERFRMAAGRAPVPSRGRLWVLVAAALTAGFLALGSFGWAIAQRGRAQTLQERMVDAQKKNKDLLFLIDLLKGQVGQTKWAPLVAPSGAPGIGTAIIFSAPKIDDILFMDIPLVPVGKGPFMVQLVDGHRAINAGHVKLTAGGHLVLSPPWFTTQNLGKVITVTVIDESTGRVALTGKVEPYTP